MRRDLPIAILLCAALAALAALAACAPSAPPPTAPAPATTDPRDPRARAQAVEQATLDAKRRQDEALEKQGG